MFVSPRCPCAPALTARKPLPCRPLSSPSASVSRTPQAADPAAAADVVPDSRGPQQQQLSTAPSAGRTDTGGRRWSSQPWVVTRPVVVVVVRGSGSGRSGGVVHSGRRGGAGFGTRAQQAHVGDEPPGDQLHARRHQPHHRDCGAQPRPRRRQRSRQRQQRRVWRKPGGQQQQQQQQQQQEHQPSRLLCTHRWRRGRPFSAEAP